METPVSVNILAYNEEEGIRGAITSILKSKVNRKVELNIVANGCTDRTVDIAEEVISHHPMSDISTAIYKLKTANKPNAWNYGKNLSSHPYIAYMDGDVVLGETSLEDCCNELDSNPKLKVIFPLGKPNYDGASHLMRSVYHAYHHIERTRIHGAFYVLTKEGIAQIGEMPAIINDDQFIGIFFKDYEMAVNRNCFVQWVQPVNIASFLRLRRRIETGRIQLKKLFPHLNQQRYSQSEGVIEYLASDPMKNLPRLSLAIAISLFGKVLGHFNYYFGDINRWERTKSR